MYTKAWGAKWKNKNKNVEVSNYWNYCSLGHSPEHVIFSAAILSILSPYAICQPRLSWFSKAALILLKMVLPVKKIGHPWRNGS